MPAIASVIIILKLDQTIILSCVCVSLEDDSRFVFIRLWFPRQKRVMLELSSFITLERAQADSTPSRSPTASPAVEAIRTVRPTVQLDGKQSNLRWTWTHGASFINEFTHCATQNTNRKHANRRRLITIFHLLGKLYCTTIAAKKSFCQRWTQAS